jgi:predicted MPP superfamily phosphohydrolase
MQPITDKTTLDLLESVEEKLEDYVPDLKQSMVINGQAHYLTWDFRKTSLPEIEILQITDIQFGHKACDVDKLTEYLRWVLDSPSRYIILGGDLVDAGHKLSKGSPFEQIGDPQEEMWALAHLLAPVRHRVLGYVGGNHERRSIDTFGDLGKSIAMILQIPYSPGKQHIDILFGDHKPFKITIWHGGGSGASKGAIANSVYRLMGQADSQLYLIGHLHQAVVLPDWRESRTGKGTMQLTKIIGAMGTSFLKHYGTYAEVIMGTKPTGIMMARAILEKNGKWEVTLR